MDKVKNKQKVVASLLKRVRDAFYSTAQELRSELSQGLTSEEMPPFREAFASLLKEVEPEVKSFAFYKNDSVVLASNQDNSPVALMAFAVKAYNEGFKDEAHVVFDLAASKALPLQAKSMSTASLVQGACPACGSALPLVANNCPMCGINLNQGTTPVVQQTNNQVVEKPAILPPELENVIAMLTKEGKHESAARLIKASLKK